MLKIFYKLKFLHKITPYYSPPIFISIKIFNFHNYGFYQLRLQVSSFIKVEISILHTEVDTFLLCSCKVYYKKNKPSLDYKGEYFINIFLFYINFLKQYSRHISNDYSQYPVPRSNFLNTLC